MPVSWHRLQLQMFSTIPSTARVFEEAGWLGRDAVLMTGINAIIYVLSTLPPYVLVCLDPFD
jgi:hypothetical protein